MKILYHDTANWFERGGIYFISCASPRELDPPPRVLQVCEVPDEEPCRACSHLEALALEEKYSPIAAMERKVKAERKTRGRSEWQEEV